MDSKETDNSKKNTELRDFDLSSIVEKTKRVTHDFTENEMKPLHVQSIEESAGNEQNTANEDNQEIEKSEDIEQTEPSIFNNSTKSNRISSKQRKESFEDYRETFLRVPKIEDRKPVFVSCGMRDKLDEIVRKLGGRKMSVSGLIENLVRYHLEIYKEDFETWKKL
jgi:hypothetical protein